MKEKECIICGQIFIPRSSRQKCCNKPVTRTCVVCGKPFESKCTQYPLTTCEDPKCKYATMHGHINLFLEERKCKGCGETFKPKRATQVFCGQVKHKSCPICGKDIEYVCNGQSNQTCSPECQAQLIVKKRTESALALTRVCKWCGKEFHPKDHREIYCEGPHYKKCVICGKEFEIDPVVDPNVMTCSKECMGQLMSQNHDYVKGSETQKQHLLEKYGVTNAMQVPGAVDKLKQTNKEKYGTEWYTQTAEYRSRVEQTCLEKYGVTHHLQAQLVKEKRAQTFIERYGTDNVFKAKEIKEKIKQTNLEKYGTEYATQSDQIKQKTLQTNLGKYGVKHPMMLPLYQNKAIQTNMIRYGRKAYTQQHIEHIQDWYEFINNPEQYITSHYEQKPRVEELASDLGVNQTTVDVYLQRNHARDCVRRARSLMEDYFRNFLCDLLPDTFVISNDKTAIRPLELDLYLPEYKFAIECNPTCTHNSSVADPWGGEAKPHRYHQQKTIACEEAGIQLFHVFSYEWEHKREIIESMIKNRIGKCDRVIYARKCKVVEVSGGDAIRFLNMNHRQGAAFSPIRLGLEYNGELVSLMTFGKMRNSIGTGKEELSNCYELVRFCSLLNTSVVGGASKLFKYFVKEYNPIQIRSFSDRAHTSGHLYPTLGFVEVRKSDPGYVWVDVVTDIAYHRSNAQKKNIKRFLRDDSIDLSKTEAEIMMEHGFVQVFDCGTITWEWQV